MTASVFFSPSGSSSTGSVSSHPAAFIVRIPARFMICREDSVARAGCPSICRDRANAIARVIRLPCNLFGSFLSHFRSDGDSPRFSSTRLLNLYLASQSFKTQPPLLINCSFASVNFSLLAFSSSFFHWIRYPEAGPARRFCRVSWGLEIFEYDGLDSVL